MKMVVATVESPWNSFRRGGSSEQARALRDIDDKRPGLVSESRWSVSSPRTLVARAHINTHRFLSSPTALDVSVANASPPGPFSQALARALVPHLFNTSGTMGHPRNHRRRRRRCRFYESLKVRQLTRAYRNASYYYFCFYNFY